MTEYKNLKRQELLAKAKELGLTIKFGSKNQEIIEALIKAENSNKIETKEKNKSSEFVEIPKSLHHLGLTPVKRMTPEEARINRLVGKRRKPLSLPQEIEERLDREGFYIGYPSEKDGGRHIQEFMRKGYEFILDDNGEPFKIDSKECNEKGERLYHIAMKIPKEIIDKQKELETKKYQEENAKMNRGDLSHIKGLNTQSEGGVHYFSSKNNLK